MHLHENILFGRLNEVLTRSCRLRDLSSSQSDHFTFALDAQDSTRSPQTPAHELHALMRQASHRLSTPSGWKRQLPWFIAALGNAMDLSRAYVYKNHPDDTNTLTAVRIAGWTNPLHDSLGGETDPRVTTYDTPFFAAAKLTLSARESLVELADRSSHSEPSTSGAVNASPGTNRDAIIMVPIFAGDQWWGFIGAERSADAGVLTAESEVTLLENFLWTGATIIGDAIQTNSVQQALRWSEQLQRIQRDIALAATRGTDHREALSELLGLICELGDFESGIIEFRQEGDLATVATYGNPPAVSEGFWCDACRPTTNRHRNQTEPVYVGSEALEACQLKCPIKTHRIHSLAMIPIVHQETVTGYLELFSDRRTHVPQAIRHSIEAVAAEVAMVIARVRSEEMRIRSEQRASGLAQRLRLAVEAGQVGVFDIDLSTNMIRFDPPFHAFLGLPPDLEVVALERALSYFSESDANQIRALLGSLPASWPGDLRREFHLVPNHAPPIWLSVNARLIRGDQGYQLIGTAVDITRMKRYQREISRAQREAADSSLAKSEFMARMSHEFRTPLNAILGSVQLMQPGTDDSFQESLSQVERSAGHLLALVEDILDQSRLESGHLHVAPVPTDLGSFVRGLETDGHMMCDGRGLAFAIELEGPLPAKISIDEVRLNQVLRNLITNAAKYTDAGKVVVRARWRDQRLRLVVADSGRGIPADERESVFLPFRQSSLTDDEGSGLGLAISRELVQLMGARIWLWSQLDTGSVFWFTIPAPVVDSSEDLVTPASAPASSAPASSAPASSAPASPTSGLVADAHEPTIDPPRPEDLEELERHLRIGDIAAVRQLLERIREADAGSAEFARRATELADGFRIRAIRDLVKTVQDGSARR